MFSYEWTWSFPLWGGGKRTLGLATGDEKHGRNELLCGGEEGRQLSSATCWDSVSRVAGLSVPAGAGVAAHAEFQGACPLGSEPASQFQAQCWTPGPCWELPCQEQPGGWYHSFTVWDGGRSGGVASQKRKPTSGPKLPWSPCAACDSGSTGQGFLSPKERQVACPSPGSI